MKNIKNVTVAVVAVTVLFFGSLLVFSVIDDAHAVDTHRTHTIQLGADLDGTTLVVSQYDTVIIDDYYHEWYGGWANSKYSEEYRLGTTTNSDQIINVVDVNTITDDPGLKTVHFYKEYIDHFPIPFPKHRYTHYSFTLDVREGKTITYKSNTNDFRYDWVDTARHDGYITIRNVSNVLTGHDFVGWNTESDGNGVWYQPGEDISDTATLYAQWAPKLIVTSDPEITLDKGSSVDYSFTYNQPGASVKIIDKQQMESLNLSNGRLTGTVDNEPGKYTVKFQIEKGLQKADFFLTIYVRIYEIEPIDEYAHTGETWIRNIELMPANITYNLTYGSVTRTHEGITEPMSPASVGLSNLSGTTVSGTFLSPGTYLINITVSAPHNPELKSTNVQMKVLVEDPEPTVSAPSLVKTTISKSNIADTYDFYVVDPTDYLQIVWNFGDGVSATGQSATHHYNYPGLYQWTLTLKAYEGFADVVRTGWVLSHGPQEIPVDAWIDTKYAVLIQASVSAVFNGPDFLTATSITDDASGESYLLIAGTPDAENWATETGNVYAVSIADGTDIIEWTITLHGVSESAPVSSFLVSVDGYTVSVKYLGSKNAVVYIAWDGTNYVRLSGITGTYEYNEIGSYVRPVIVTQSGTQISDTVSFEIRNPEEISVTVGVIHDLDLVVGERFDVPITLHPYGSSVVVSGADWIKYSSGHLTGTPDLPGKYTVSVYASYGSATSVTQSFVVNVTVDMPGSDSVDDASSLLNANLVFVLIIGVLGILTLVTRDIRFGIATVLISIIFFGVIL